MSGRSCKWRQKIKNKRPVAVQRKCRAESLGRGAQERTMLLRSSAETSGWTRVNPGCGEEWEQPEPPDFRRYVEKAVMGVLLPVPKKCVCSQERALRVQCVIMALGAVVAPEGAAQGSAPPSSLCQPRGCISALQLAVVWVTVAIVSGRRGKKTRRGAPGPPARWGDACSREAPHWCTPVPAWREGPQLSSALDAAGGGTAAGWQQTLRSTL